MDNLAYFKIEEEFSPRDASDVLETAVKAGYNRVILLHQTEADIKRAWYKERLMSVFRAAYRHKAQIYIADDSFMYSGTAFGELSSVSDMWLKKLVKLKSEDVGEEEVLGESNGESIVVRNVEEDEKYPYRHYVDLTNPYAAQMVIESVYEPLCREYEKFMGYEFKGFISINPCYIVSEDVPYSKAALEKMGEVNLFALFDKGEEYEKYLLKIRECMEEGYLRELKLFCEMKNLEFIVCGGENSAGREFLDKYSLYPVTNTLGEGVLMGADSVKKVSEAAMEGVDCVLCVNSVMKKIHSIKEEILSIKPDCKKTDIYELDLSGNECLVTNMTDTVRSVGFLIEDWCIADDKGEVYETEKTTYTFHPYSFLYLVKKESGMYPEKLPVKIGGVEIGEWEADTEIEFTRSDNIYGFYLPDMPLFEKHISFEGDFEFLRVRIGSMEECLVQAPFIMPLFDFLREARGGVEAIGGTITKIEIMK